MTTTYKLDFKEVAAKANIDRVVQLLGIEITSRTGPQLRGKCPLPDCGALRAFGIHSEKKRWNCFTCQQHGDAIALVEKVRGISTYEAAKLVAGRDTLGNSSTVPGPRTVPNSSPSPSGGKKPVFDVEAYAKTLDPEHASLEPLGVSPETLRQFRAGYSSAGQNRGRVALPVQDRQGAVVCFCGRSVKDETPLLVFPRDFDPREHIFGAHRVTQGELYVVRDPLQVLTAFEAGMENVVAFLTDGISAQQWEMLSSLMDERKCELSFLY